MKQTRVLILVDGSNFYFKLKGLGFNNLVNFDFANFAKFLSREVKIIGSNYYIGRVRQDGTKKADRMVSDQQKLFQNLKDAGFKYILGYLLKNNGVYHEKGVDVQMAVDIMVASYEDLCDRIIIVSSDTDLAPAIKKAREKGKIVEYIGFSNKPSVAMVSFCSESRLMTREDMERFIIDKKDKK